MNIIPDQDWQKAVDFAGFSSVSAELLNQSFDGIQPNTVEEDPLQGLGLVLTTIDSAVGVPVVPDPIETVDFEKWKRYFWNRIPHENAVAPNNRPITYSWVETVSNDATYYKWIPSQEDLSSYKTQTTTNTNNINTVTNLVNAANTNASNALTIANAASTTATAANSNAATAVANAATANTAATTALNAANTANSNATAAQAAAANAVTVAAGNKLVTQITPGTAGQMIRTKDDASANEYFDPYKTIVILGEQVTNGGSGVAGAYASATFASGAYATRVLEEVADAGDLCTMAGNAFTLAKGWYRIQAHVPFADTTIASSLVAISRLFNVTDNQQVAASTFNAVSNVDNAAAVAPCVGVNYIGYIFYTDGTKQYRIETYSTGGTGTRTGGRGFSNAGGPNPNRYTWVELQKIG